MLKEKHLIYTRLDFIANAIIAGFSFVLSVKIKTYLDTGSFAIGDIYQRYLELGYILMILWPVLLSANGIHPVSRFRTIKRAAIIIVKSGLEGAFLMFALFFMFRLHIVSRVVIGTFSIVVTVFLILKELGIIWLLHVVRKQGSNLRHILIVGTFDSARDIASKIEKNTYLGLNIAGILVPKNELQKREIRIKDVLGTLDDIERVLNNNPVDSVIITLSRKGHYEDIDNVILLCEERGVEICLVPDILNIKLSRLDTDDILGVPLVTFNIGPGFTWQLFLKNIADRICGLILYSLSLPIIAIAAILIKTTSSGPAFFKQIRCSVRGREFILYKLRTMYIDADKTKKKLLRMNIMKGPVFKIEKDPRITPIGLFLRRASIDEMPQFWNVVKGDMSIIGPRPPIPEEVKRYKGWQRRRLSMKPGITGLWQVKGRSDVTDFNKLTELDLQYIDNWSLWLDIKIFFKTIWVVVSCKGAK
ncbi:sugar transferase [Omnitrophica bacterium]|nr:sugar transferase [Candidatus Omnitrophota bacterium]